MKWHKYEQKDPPAGKDVLVYFPSGSSNFDVRHFVPRKMGYAWGWYPGGREVSRTWWTELPDPEQVFNATG